MKAKEYTEAGVILWSELHYLMLQGENDCDTIVWDGNSFISNLIGWFSGAGSDGMSHASLIMKQPKFNRVLLAESNFQDRQLVYRSVTDKLIKQHGTAYWVRTRMSQEQRWKAFVLVNNMVLQKTSYDTKGLFEYAGNKLFPKLIKPPKLHDTTAFCSAVITYVYQFVDYITAQEYAIAPEQIPNLLGIDVVRIAFDCINIDW